MEQQTNPEISPKPNTPEVKPIPPQPIHPAPPPPVKPVPPAPEILPGKNDPPPGERPTEVPRR